MFVLTYSHSCLKVGLPPSVSFRKKQYRVCYWSKMMIKGAVCRTNNRPAIQLCYPAVNCSRQVVSSFLPGRLGQVQRLVGCRIKSTWPIFTGIILIYQSKANLHVKILFGKGTHR